eukprot:469176_1
MGTVLLPNSAPTDKPTSLLDRYLLCTLNIAPDTSIIIIIHLIIIIILFGVRHAKYMKRCRSVSNRVLVEEKQYQLLTSEPNTKNTTTYKTDDTILPPKKK